MAIVFGVIPGRSGHFATAALYYDKGIKSSLVLSKTLMGVDDAIATIIGLVGEWGDLSAVAVAAPLTWSGAAHGWRSCDVELRERLPAWAPRSWLRPPNTLPGSVSVQGPALVWALANEIKNGQLPKHALVETWPRLSLALSCEEDVTSILGATNRGATAVGRRESVASLIKRFSQGGIIEVEIEPPNEPEEIEALIAALTALAVAVPTSGLITLELSGGAIRPVGDRPVVLLQGLPKPIP